MHARSGTLKEMPANPKDADTKLPKPADARKLERPDAQTSPAASTLKHALDGSAKLTETTLSKSLNAACAALANYLQAHTEAITLDQLANLPDFVFELALFAGWLPGIPIGPGYITEEPDADHVMLGNQIVDRTFREQFVALIQETLDDVRHYDEGEALHYYQEQKELERKEWLLDEQKQEFERLGKLLNSDSAPKVGPKEPDMEPLLPAPTLPETVVRVNNIIDQYIRLSPDVTFDYQIAQKATLKRRKIDHGNVNPVHMTRIRKGECYDPIVCQAVAEVLKEKVPCSREDLLPPDWVSRRRGQKHMKLDETGEIR